MRETWKEMFDFFRGYYNNGLIIFLYMASLLIIMLLGKEKLRKQIGWPTLVIMFLVYNPFFYRYIWQKCFHYGYWRVFWLFPVVLVVSVAVLIVVDRIKQPKRQGIFLLIILILICGNSKNVFSKQLFYTNTQNIYKLPQEAIDVSDALLQLDTEPKVVMCSQLYSYVRQYSTDIKMMYGRNIEGYIDGWNQKTAEMASNLQELEKADWGRVGELMKQEQYKYIVIPQNENCSEEYMKQFSFVLLKQVDGYDIFEIIY